jgi:pimeloyl-[acyl-carrier protein] methyl ester esterase
MLPIVLLPGLDGTGKLYSSFVQTAPPGVNPIVIPLPELGTYDELIEPICSRLPPGLFAIVGESFSGPIAVEVACRLPKRVVALVLCNSFISAPRMAAFRFLPWRLLFRIPVPRWAIRTFFLGWSAPATLVSEIRSAVAGVPSELLAARMLSVFALRPTNTTRIEVPVLSLSATHDVLVRHDVHGLEGIARRVTQRRIAGPHLLLQAAPKEAWREISAFLSEIGAPTRKR